MHWQLKHPASISSKLGRLRDWQNKRKLPAEADPVLHLPSLLCTAAGQTGLPAVSRYSLRRYPSGAYHTNACSHPIPRCCHTALVSRTRLRKQATAVVSMGWCFTLLKRAAVLGVAAPQILAPDGCGQLQYGSLQQGPGPELQLFGHAILRLRMSRSSQRLCPVLYGHVGGERVLRGTTGDAWHCMR